MNNPLQSILVASPEREVAGQFTSSLPEKYTIDCVYTRADCRTAFQGKKYDIVFIDICFLGSADPAAGMAFYRQELQWYWNQFPATKLVVLAPAEEIRQAVSVVKAGATDYITFPLDPAEISFIIEDTYSAMLRESELHYLRDQFWQEDSLEVIRTESPVMEKVLDKVKSVAPTKTTVLLTGETGTGKGVIARLIHRHSNRHANQFISVHCGAIPDTLIESELFGHEKGSFTGAVRRKLGKFEIASGGSLFLDEIGTVSPAVQIKLLQVLQDKSFQRVGGEEDIEAEVRIIAATNEDLAALSQAGTFRRDLFYRLSVFPIEIPPLRKRKEDIPLLAETFLKRLNRMHSKEINGLHPRVMRAFETYDWPGNIRELENLIERAYILEQTHILTPESFPAEIFPSEGPALPIEVDPTQTLREVRRQGIGQIERKYLQELLARNQGRINASAAMAGITTRQLHKLLTRYGIRKTDYK